MCRFVSKKLNIPRKKYHERNSEKKEKDIERDIESASYFHKSIIIIKLFI